MSDEAADHAPALPSPRPAASVLAGLIATAPLAPVLGVATTVLLFMSAGAESRPVLWGFVSAAVLWVVGAVSVAPFMTMERANRSVYRSLVTRVNALDTGDETSSGETRDHLVRLGSELNVDISRSADTSGSRINDAFEKARRQYDDATRGDHA